MHCIVINDKDYAKYPLYQYFVYHKRKKNQPPKQNNNNTTQNTTTPPHLQNLTGLMSNTKISGLVHSL